MCIIREEEAAHSLSSDLGSLINDEKSSDLILQAGERYETERDRERQRETERKLKKRPMISPILT